MKTPLFRIVNVKSSLFFAALLVTSSLGTALAQDQEKLTQPGVITGSMDIDFRTRKNVNEKGQPQKGEKDIYNLTFNVAKTTEFKGKIERTPYPPGRARFPGTKRRAHLWDRPRGD